MVLDQEEVLEVLERGDELRVDEVDLRPGELDGHIGVVAAATDDRRRGERAVA
jgi:hypothetical protein